MTLLSGTGCPTFGTSFLTFGMLSVTFGNAAGPSERLTGVLQSTLKLRLVLSALSTYQYQEMRVSFIWQHRHQTITASVALH